MNHPEDIKKANWLNESQKLKLLAVYETIHWKDVIEQSFDMLDLFQSTTFDTNATAYKNMVVEIMANLSSLKLNSLIAKDYGLLLNNLYLFFDSLDNESFDKMVQIEKAYNYSNENNGHETTIEKLYQETLKETIDKLDYLRNGVIENQKNTNINIISSNFNPNK